jgi:hypothetical protein
MMDPSRFTLSSLTAAFFVVLCLGLTPQTWADLPPLIPREIFFGNPEKLAPQISPDGRRLAWLAPDKKNVLQVWIKTVGKDDDKVVTADKKRGIRNYQWAKNSTTLIYLQDADGDENWHVYGVDLDSGNIRDYTPFQGVRADIVATNIKFPGEILVRNEST